MDLSFDAAEMAGLNRIALTTEIVQVCAHAHVCRGLSLLGEVYDKLCHFVEAIFSEIFSSAVYNDGHSSGDALLA